MSGSVRPLQGPTFVTGAARGLGAAMAREFALRGATVALLGREESALADVRETIPGPARCWEVDVTDDDAMRRVAADVRDSLGPASVVVANAGVAEGGPFAESDPALWRRVIEVSLVGSAGTARVFLADLRASRGYYLQIASLASIGASPLLSAYCASKAGVESFAHSLRAEVAHEGIDVGIAYLNWTDTDMRTLIRCCGNCGRTCRGPRGRSIPSRRWPPVWCGPSSGVARPCTPRPGSVPRRPSAPRCPRWSPSCRSGSFRACSEGPPSRRRGCWEPADARTPTDATGRPPGTADRSHRGAPGGGALSTTGAVFLSSDRSPAAGTPCR